MSSTVTALPRSGWWSWRLTPKIQIRLTVDEQLPSRTSTLTEPDELGVHLDDRPVGAEQLGDARGSESAARRDHGSTPASSNRLDGDVAAEHVRLGELVRHRVVTGRRQPAAAERLDRRAHRPARPTAGRRPTDRGRHVERADAVGDAEPGVADQ